VAAAGLVPLGTWVVSERFQERVLERAVATPLVVGAKGSRMDLVLTALFFRGGRLPGISMADFERVRGAGLGVAVPLNLAHTARDAPVVATSVEYFERRGLRVREGRLPAVLGEAVLGAGVSRRLGIGVGGAIFSDQRELYDISRPASLKMHVVGVLEASASSDDEAVFVDTGTAWVIDGLSHGHADAKAKLPAELIVERGTDNVNVSEALIDYNEVTPENIGTFHLHAEPEQLPLTAVLVFPPDQKSATILKSRVNEGRVLQAHAPREVVEEMLRYVVRIRQLLAALSVVLGGLTAVMIGLVTALSVRIRAREIESLVRIGASPGTVVSVFALEVGLVLGVGLALSVAGAGVLVWLAPDLIKFV
ncbi:MAG: hypothetical protein K2Q20_08175, partial [Phycisphaerales bacterium]|nr:hypothetical protein [Phycisphaerales bacterium]